MKAIRDRCDNTEIAAAALERPKQVRMLFRVGTDRFAFGGYKLIRRSIVASQAASAHEPSNTAAECQARDAGRRNQTSRGCQAIFLSRSIELTPKQASLRDGRPCALVDLDALHPGYVDDQSVIDDGCTRNVVAAGADGRIKVVIGREEYRAADVLDAAATQDGMRAPVDHAVPDSARSLVVSGLGGNDFSAEVGSQLVQIQLRVS